MLRTAPVGVVLALVLALTASTSAQPFEEPTGFQKVPFGSDSTSIRAAYPGARCSFVTNTEQVCRVSAAIGHMPVTIDFILRGDPTVMDTIVIPFASEHYDDMRAAFIGRYGPPTTVNAAPVSNRMGATFPSETLFWLGQRAQIMLTQHNKTLAVGRALIATKTAVDASKEKSDERRRTLKDGL